MHLELTKAEEIFLVKVNNRAVVNKVVYVYLYGLKVKSDNQKKTCYNTQVFTFNTLEFNTHCSDARVLSLPKELPLEVSDLIKLISMDAIGCCK